jgi:TonB family protein
MRSTAISNHVRASIIALSVAVLAPAIAFGQIVAPTPQDQAQPEPPTNRFDMPIEGWAVVRYSVLADGTIADLRIVDRMPADLADRAVLPTVEAWTFNPATSDGAVVDWHNGESLIVFDPETVPFEPRQPFVNGYREVAALLEAGESEDALRRSQRLISMETARLAEMGVALVQNARVNLLLQNQHEAFAAIKRATDPRLELLAPSELIVALDYRNRLELGLGDVVGALQTFARREMLGAVPDSDPMAGRAEVIEAALAGGETAIAVKGKILDDAWSHTLARRTFAIGDLDGSLRTVNVECDRGRTALEYSEESEWSLPESWGVCHVAVEGRRDSEFVLYEFQ